MLSSIQQTLLFAPVFYLLLSLCLLLVWNKNRSQNYIRDLGLAYIANSMVAILAVPYFSGTYWVFVLASIGFCLTFVLYSVAMFMALVHLSGNSFSRSRIKVLALLYCAIFALYAVFVVLHLAQYFQGVMIFYTVVIGALASYWLWPRQGLHRWIGPLIILNSLTGLMFVFLGMEWVLIQLYIQLSIRLVLVLIFVYIALDQALQEQKQSEKARLKLLDQLHHSQKMDALGQLAGGVAHDFNNLLGGIVGAAELLQMEGLEAQDRQHYLGLITSASKKAADLTAKLLSIARQGHRPTDRICVDQMVRDTVSLLERTLDKRVQIQLEIHSPNLEILGDEAMLQSALINMGVNASHAMPGGGVLSFGVTQIHLSQADCSQSAFEIEAGEFVEIEIRDTGTGMSKEVLKRIFEPFFTTKEKGKGTGLGLAAVYGTIQDHCGALHVYSELGQGTVFHLYLPMRDSLTQVLNPKEEGVCFGSGRVLLVDDDELIQETGRKLLEFLGYQVQVAKHGLEALAIYAEQWQEIDLVVLDMMMPVMDGREAFEKMRAINPLGCFLVTSGFSKNEDLDRMLQMGLQGFIYKPFRLRELSQAIAQVLNKPSPDQEIQG